jgi:hypothetical protein
VFALELEFTSFILYYGEQRAHTSIIWQPHGADSVRRWSAVSTTKGCHRAAVCLLINYSASALLISDSSTLLH